MPECIECKKPARIKFCSKECRIKHFNQLRKTRPNWKDHQKKKRERMKKDNPVKFKTWKQDFKLRDKQCSKCGATDNLEYHHTDYEKHEGVTLCRCCHMAVHQNS